MKNSIKSLLTPIYFYIPGAYFYFNIFHKSWSNLSLFIFIVCIPFLYLIFILKKLKHATNKMEIMAYTYLPSLLSAWVIVYFLSGMDHLAVSKSFWELFFEYSLATILVGLVLNIIWGALGLLINKIVKNGII